MAFIELNYHSDVLKQGVTVNVILPETAKTLIGMKSDGADTYKTLYLFHGLSDDHTIWMRRTAIERYAAQFGISVVMPSVGRSWYTDMACGGQYFTFVTEELPSVCRNYFRGMSDKREDNLVAGLSMGGYGAVKAALLCPDKFGYCASLSGALDIASFGDRADFHTEWRSIFGQELNCAADLRNTDHDLLSVAVRNAQNGVSFPKLFLWCGSDDSLLGQNRAFHEKLKDLRVPHSYLESEGNHSWKWWDLHIQTALKDLLAKN